MKRYRSPPCRPKGASPTACRPERRERRGSAARHAGTPRRERRGEQGERRRSVAEASTPCGMERGAAPDKSAATKATQSGQTSTINDEDAARHRPPSRGEGQQSNTTPHGRHRESVALQHPQRRKETAASAQLKRSTAPSGGNEQIKARARAARRGKCP